LTARAINRAIGTNLAPWDIEHLDEALIGAILATLQPEHTALPASPLIERRKAEIRAAYWRRLGLTPPVYH
jgi:hypothetical protein